jgi:type IX secretion system PorP/SprF family membrane protein
MRVIITTYIGFLLISLQTVFAQEYVLNQFQNLQMLNPSYYGFNNLTKAGVLYNSMSYDTDENIDTKVAFGSINFENLNFSLGLDVNSFKINSYGLEINQINLAYVYKINLNYETYILPAAYIGIAAQSLESSKLIFEDQINLISGFIASQSDDPLANIDHNSNYFDMGASVLIYNEKFMAGLSLKHLNQPDISYNNESIKKGMMISVQGAYEFNINYYERNFLPRYSYLLLYFSASSSGKLLKAYASQELQLSNFTIGIHQQLSSLESFSFMNAGINAGVNAGNINFNVSYSFPMSQDQVILPPSMLELSLTFDFNPFIRNNRGDFKRLRTDNF